MQSSQKSTPMFQQHTTPVFYDLGQHTLEVTDEGEILLAAQVMGTMPPKESVYLDQNEAYRLFLVLEAWFREQAGTIDQAAKRSESCS